MTSTAAMNI